MPDFTLTLRDADHADLMRHLFCGDGKESAAIGLCSIAASSDPRRLLLRELAPVPVEVCTTRTDVSIVWPVEWLDPLLVRAETEGLSLVKFHCHPGDYPFFSDADDESDVALFEGIHGYLDNDLPHGSVVVLPSGRMIGRVALSDGEFVPMKKIAVVGRMPKFWVASNDAAREAPISVGRHSRGFGQEMRSELRQLSVAVVGVSGTGSIVAEQLGRLNIGRIVLVDPEEVENKNLDRILNANAASATKREKKVDLARRSVEALGFGTAVIAKPNTILDREAVEAVAGCDIVFGCVDGAEGRSILDRLAVSQLQILIDMGVGAEADENGAIDQIDIAINFIFPGGSSLLSRGVYTPEEVHAEMMQRLDPEEYERLRAQKYIRGRAEEQPAVVSINMIAAANAVLELLARLYPYRHEPDVRKFDAVRVNLAEMEITTEIHDAPCPVMGKLIARGDREPLLNLPQIAGGK